MISYGPIILPLLIRAAEILSNEGIEAKVVNLPWLNRIDSQWLEETLLSIPAVACVDNHMTFGGQGEEIEKLVKNSPKLKEIKVGKIGIDGVSRTGAVMEILRYFHLDPESLVSRIKGILR